MSDNDPTLEPATKGLREFCQQLFGPAVDQIGQIGGDWARLWRLKNLVSIHDKFDRILQDRKIDPSEGRHLALSVGLPMLEKASYQDDEVLQEKWAHLIASSLSSDERSESDFRLDTTYVETLHQFSRLDCDVLEFIVRNGVENRDKNGTHLRLIDPDEIEKAFSHRDWHISLEKLISLGCVSRDPKLPLKPGGSRGLVECITPTIIGINLYIAASGEKPEWFFYEDE